MDKSTRILIVDDEEIVRLGYSRTLREVCCNVEEAVTGSEALRVMEGHPVDVVLLDLRMAGMDGMTVLKTIKERWPESEVVVVTGYPTLEAAKEAVRLGAYDYLAKPVGPAEILKAACGAVKQKAWTLHTDRKDRDVRTGSGARSGTPASHTAH